MSNVEKRKNFLINLMYLGVILFMFFLGVKFTLKNLMPFVIGFLIATILKPLVRKLDTMFKPNKIVSILVNIAFYIVVALLITWAVFGGVAFVQRNIPVMERYLNNTVLPMINELLIYFEQFTDSLDPDVTAIINNVINDLMNNLKGLIESFSKFTLALITGVLSSAPKIMISILLTVISSFFFSLDYQLVIDSFVKLLPDKFQILMDDVRVIFSELIGKYFIAYGKLILLTFVELSIGFLLLGIDSPFVLAAVISVVDILPVLGTGTILIPWALYELVLGTPTLGLGIVVIYAIITVIRNVLEPKLVGAEIGLHPLMTLVSIYIGLTLFGFVGLFVVPISVTILKRLIDEGTLSIKAFFDGESIINVGEDD